jgi:hypothetical protein
MKVEPENKTEGLHGQSTRDQAFAKWVAQGKDDLARKALADQRNKNDTKKVSLLGRVFGTLVKGRGR